MPNGPVDAIVVDVPLFLRLLEFAREDAQTDMDLHTLTENLLKGLESKTVLTMDDYDTVVPQAPQARRQQTMASLRDFFTGAAGRRVKNAPKTEYRKLAYYHRYLDETDKDKVEDKMKTLLPQMTSKDTAQLDSLVPNTLDLDIDNPHRLPGVVKK